MAHEVETMMYVGKTPWHGLGMAIPEGKRLSIDEAIRYAGLDWETVLRPLYTEGRTNLIGLLEARAACRTTDDTVLGVVGPEYEPLQNRDAFRWFQPFLDTGQATIETAGSLKHGRKVWVLARIRSLGATIGDGDRVDHYVLLSNAHDGSLPVRVGFTPIRVVCNNTLCLAHESGASKLLRVKHTANLHENLAHIREIMDLARQEFTATIDQFRFLAGRKIDRNDLERYVKIVFSLPATGGEKLIPAIIHLLEHGRGSDRAGRTYWGAYNAVNEYLNYFRGKTQDNTLSSLWFGQSAAVNKRAVEIAIKMAKAA